jgi:hypothetical protein
MKTVKANKFEKAIKELMAFSKDLEGVIGEDIPVANSNHYNAIMIKVIDNPGSPKNIVKADVMTFDKIRFERMLKKFPFHGFSKMIVLHDPSLNPKSDSPIVPGHVKSQTEAEIRKELEAEFDERLEAKIKEKMDAMMELKAKGAKKEDEDGEGSEGGEKISSDDIEKLTVDELKQYAKDNEIDLTGLKVKEDIKGAVMAWIEDQNNQ